MELLKIPETKNTLGIVLNPEGYIRFDGRGLNTLDDKISIHIIDWLSEYLINPPEITTIIIALEYLNSLSSKMLILILKEVSKLLQLDKQFFVHWCYEEDDEDILERGEYISTSLNIPIDFIRVNNIKMCFRSFT